MLAYLSRDPHRVAISNRRLIAADAQAVTDIEGEKPADLPVVWATEFEL